MLTAEKLEEVGKVITAFEVLSSALSNLADDEQDGTQKVGSEKNTRYEPLLAMVRQTDKMRADLERMWS
jgi:hypothetical protein